MSLVLKEVKVSEYLIKSGSLFQSLAMGNEYAKESVAIGRGSRYWDRQNDGP